MALLDFDASAIPERSFDVIPPNVYEAVVIASESRSMRTGNGMGFKFTFEIISGEMKGRRFVHWVTFEHRSCPMAQEIGREELAALCRAVGVLQPKDTDDLHNIPVMVSLGLDKSDPTRNEVRAVKAKGTVSWTRA